MVLTWVRGADGALIVDGALVNNPTRPSPAAAPQLPSPSPEVPGTNHYVGRIRAALPFWQAIS